MTARPARLPKISDIACVLPPHPAVRAVEVFAVAPMRRSRVQLENARNDEPLLYVAFCADKVRALLAIENGGDAHDD